MFTIATHYCLSIVDMTELTLACYDPLKINRKTETETIQRFFLDMSFSIKIVTPIYFERQQDTYNCGPIVLAIAYKIAQCDELDFVGEDMTAFRILCIYALLHNGFFKSNQKNWNLMGHPVKET